MKKILAFFLVTLFSLSVGAAMVKAAEDNVLGIQNIKAEKPPAVAYDLPYPGILPDNPVYFLKQARDFLSGLTIADPLTKGQYYLLQADKQLASGIILLAKGNKTIAARSFLVAEKYLSKAFDKEDESRLKGNTSLNLLSRLSAAVRKHREVIDGNGRDISSLSDYLQAKEILAKSELRVTKVFGEKIEKTIR